MKKIVKILSITMLLILTMLTVTVNAQGLQAINNGLLRAFALYAGETEASITVLDAYSIFNEETENDDITIELESSGLADGTEIEVSIQGYTLENQKIRRGFSIYSKK